MSHRLRREMSVNAGLPSAWAHAHCPQVNCRSQGGNSCLGALLTPAGPLWPSGAVAEQVRTPPRGMCRLLWYILAQSNFEKDENRNGYCVWEKNPTRCVRILSRPHRRG